MKHRDYSAEGDVWHGILEINNSMRRWSHELDAIEEMPVGESVETSVGGITKVEQKIDHSFDFDYNTVYMIFEWNERFFKYTGWKSSYGTSHWNDWVEEVEKKEETRIFYE